MAKKKVANGGIASASGSSTSTSPIPAISTTKGGITTSSTPEPSAYSRVDIMSASAALTAAGREPIKVNNVNAADLKNACDDAVKKVRFFSFFCKRVLYVATFLHLCHRNTHPYQTAYYLLAVIFTVDCHESTNLHFPFASSSKL